jgi:hypothetical protein
VPGAIFHEGATEVAARAPPSTSQIANREANVHLWIEQSSHATFVAQHGGRLRPDLHQADLANGTHGVRVVRAFDMRDRVCDIGRHALLLRFSPYQLDVSLSPSRE